MLADVSRQARRDPDPAPVVAIEAEPVFVAPYWSVIGLDHNEALAGDWETHFETNAKWRDRIPFVGGGVVFTGSAADAVNVARMAKVRFINDGPPYSIDYYALGAGWGNARIKLNGVETALAASMAVAAQLAIDTGPNTLIVMTDHSIDHFAFCSELYKSDTLVRWVNPNGE